MVMLLSLSTRYSYANTHIGHVMTKYKAMWLEKEKNMKKTFDMVEVEERKTDRWE